MIRVHVFCEGQTEEMFVRDVLNEHFSTRDIWLNPILLRTSRYGKGGVLSYEKVKTQVLRKCKEDKSSWVTTLIDYYGLPSDFPGKRECAGLTDLQAITSNLVQGLKQDIDQENFIPNFLIHEFEALLFSKPAAFGEWFDDDVVESLNIERGQFDTPEHINDDPVTAPSKRILNHCKGYQKIHHGSLIAIDIGIDSIRNECLTFNSWITQLENLVSI